MTLLPRTFIAKALQENPRQTLAGPALERKPRPLARSSKSPAGPIPGVRRSFDTKPGAWVETDSLPLFLNVPAEAITHGSQDPVGKIRLAPRTEPRIKGRGDDRRRHPFFHGRLHRPPALARIRHAPRKAC